ncbi:MAG: hypothetical protein VX951_12240 [Planctomycetota bacterium]|nr:hypothetical protein [Planctomycetota bacterium]
MDPLQFSLFFGALVVGFILISWRLAKFNTYLKEIAGLRQLNERLQNALETLEQIKVEGVDKGLGQVHEDAAEILDGVRTLVRRAAHPVDRVVEVVGEHGEVQISAGQRICAIVEERLFQIGYNKLSILSDLTGVQLEEQVAVRVECEKNGMPCKGSVVTRNGSIVEVDVHSVVKMFP